MLKFEEIWATCATVSRRTLLIAIFFATLVDPSSSPNLLAAERALNGIRPGAPATGTLELPTRVGAFRQGRWQLDSDGSGDLNPPADRDFILGDADGQRLVADWNGDGFDGVGIYRDGTWSLDYNGDGVWDGGVQDLAFQFGWTGAVPVVGDWNGDGRAKVGIFAAIFGTGIWFLDYDGNGAWDDVADKIYFLGSGFMDMQPVVGDWNGDGRTKIGVYSNGLWLLDADGDGAANDGVPESLFVLGGWEDSLPLVGDWNGDGKDSGGIYVNGYFVLDFDGDHNVDSDPEDKVYNFGWQGTQAQPLIGDWNGDGTEKIGVFVDGEWFLDDDGSGSWFEGADSTHAFGQANDLPVVGRWAPAVLVEDSVRPTATTNVQNQSSLPRDITVKLFFSERMSPATINQNTIYVTGDKPTTPAAVDLDASGTVVSLSWTGLLPANAFFEIVVSPDVTDLAGNSFLQERFPFAAFGTGPSSSGGDTVAFEWPAWLSETPLPTNFPWWQFPSSLTTIEIDPSSYEGEWVQLRDASGQNVPRKSLAYAKDLAPFSTYTLSVQTARDFAGSVVSAPPPTTITTGGATDTIRPQVVFSSPSDGDRNVPVDTTFTVTTDERIWVVSGFVYAPFGSGTTTIPFSQSEDGRTLTFTPETDLLANTEYSFALVGYDLGGNTFDPCCNPGKYYYFQFATGGPVVVDTERPMLVSTNPSNGATNVTGREVSLTFSERLQWNTVLNGLGMFVDGRRYSPVMFQNTEGTTVTMRHEGALPSRAEFAIVATDTMTDLAGNPVVPALLRYTYVDPEPAIESIGLQSVRPPNGANQVAADTSIYVFMSGPIDASSAPSAIRVYADDLLITGQVTISANDQVIRFRPDAPYPAGSRIKFVTDLAVLRDTYGRTVSNWPYETTFTVQGEQLASNVRIAYSVENSLPRNSHIIVDFDRVMDAATFTQESIQLTPVQPFSFSVENGGTRLRVIADDLFPANKSFRLQLTKEIVAMDGTPLTGYGDSRVSFFTSTAIIDEALTLDSVSPPDGTIGVGVNGTIDIVFSHLVNLLTVNESTIRWTNGDGEGVACSVSVSNWKERSFVRVTPHDPFAPQETYTLTIAGVEDMAGQVAPPVTSTFVAASVPDFVSPKWLSVSPSDISAPLNSVVSITFDEPLSSSRVSSDTVDFLYQAPDKQWIPSPATTSLSPDGSTIFVAPQGLLAPNQKYQVVVTDRVLDISGNRANQKAQTFTTGVTTDSTPLRLSTSSPLDGAVEVPVNHTVALLFDSTVRPASVGDNVTLTSNGGEIPHQRIVSDRTIELRPTTVLDPSRSYQWSVDGVEDLAGNAIVPAATGTFTTGVNADLRYLNIESFTPLNDATNVPRTTPIRVVFNQPMNPSTVDLSDFRFENSTADELIPFEISYSADLHTVILTPTNALPANARFIVTSTGSYRISSVTNGPNYENLYLIFTTGN